MFDNEKQIDNLIIRTEQGQNIVRWILDNPHVSRADICEHILTLNDEYSRLAQQLINEQKELIAKAQGNQSANNIHKDYDYE
jgi:hypothetical protein